MVAVGEDRAGAIPQPIEGARDPDAEALHADAEGLFIGGLDDQVDVVGLDRVLLDLEVVAMAVSHERRPQDFCLGRVAQVPWSRDPAGDVNGGVPELLARVVRHPRTWLGLGPRTLARTAPAPVEDRQLLQARLSLALARLAHLSQLLASWLRLPLAAAAAPRTRGSAGLGMESQA